MLSPLEQFEFIYIYKTSMFGFNMSLINGICLFFINTTYAYLFILPFFKNMHIVPSNYWQMCLEQFYLVIQNIVITNSGTVNQFFFPILLNLAIILSISNISGLIPYGFTIRAIVKTILINF